MELKELNEKYEELSFKNNPNLRPCGAKIEYTMDQLIEIKKCMDDPIYFICNYVKIVHPDRGVVKMELYEYQKRMVKSLQENRKTAIRLGRQSGKSQTSVSFLLWYVLFTDNKTAAVLANKQATAYELMDRFRFSYEGLPHWLQQGVITWNRSSVKLENGSQIFGSATSKSAIRGRSIQCVGKDVKVKVRSKVTGVISELPVGELALLLKDDKSKKDFYDRSNHTEA